MHQEMWWNLDYGWQADKWLVLAFILYSLGGLSISPHIGVDEVKVATVELPHDHRFFPLEWDFKSFLTLSKLYRKSKIATKMIVNLIITSRLRYSFYANQATATTTSNSVPRELVHHLTNISRKKNREFTIVKWGVNGPRSVWV